MGALWSTVTLAHCPHVFFTRSRALYTFFLTSSQRRTSSDDCARPQRRPAARSIEPSARHAFWQSLAAVSSSRWALSMSFDAWLIATLRFGGGCAYVPLGGA